jgi:hypothetical protein
VKKKTQALLSLFRSSGRRDLNPGPLGPEPSALAGLRYAPMQNVPKYKQYSHRMQEQE